MTRTYVVTGAASGIGRATKNLLESRGARVIGVDLRDADVVLDLSQPEQRATLVERISDASDGRIDSVIAVAGLAEPTPSTVRVNYFGVVATLVALQPLLAISDAPRAAVVSSFSALQEGDADLLAALRGADEEAAIARAEELAAEGRGALIYPSTKRAIAEWMRERSISTEWAGSAITLNAVGPGVVLTPMTAPFLETAEGRAELMAAVPMPLNGAADPSVIAGALAWLTSAENTHITGQMIFVDGGADVSVRGPRIFDSSPSYIATA